MKKSDEEWRRELTPEQFHITRQKGTERAFTGKYCDHEGKGIYRCVCCRAKLFSSEHKYDSGSGWPSFWQGVEPDAVGYHHDDSHFMRRTEIVCAECGAHLGHVFDDGPEPTRQRFCVNSASLDFVEE